MSTPWTDHEKAALRELFLERTFPIAEIARKLQRTTASINTALSLFGVPRKRWVRKFRLPTRITEALARVHAHVCGDGYLFRHRERDDYGYLKTYKRGNYRIRYGFAYTNLNPVLIQSFTMDVKEAFGLGVRYEPKRWTAFVKSKEAWDFLAHLGAGRSREWKIPREIREADVSVRMAWLQAFFDDEAHFDPQGRIRVRSVNRAGLEQAAEMLRSFLPCHITPQRGLYKDDSCYLVVLGVHRDRFMKAIGSLKFREVQRKSFIREFDRVNFQLSPDELIQTC